MPVLRITQIEHPVTGSTLRVWFESPNIGRPLREEPALAQDQRLLPRDCREAVGLAQRCANSQHQGSCAPLTKQPGRLLQGLTYKATLFMDLCYQLDNHPVQRLNRKMGGMPVMVKSRACHLRHMSRAKLVTAKEESTEMGGYFICNGIERIIRMLIQQRRHYIMALKRGAYSKRGSNYTDAATLLRYLSWPSSRPLRM